MAKITPAGYGIEVISSGSLPKSLTWADLGYKSIQHKAIIAILLHRIKFMGKAGVRIRPIRDEAQELDCPEPQFEADSIVTVICWPSAEVRAVSEDERVTREVTAIIRPSKAVSVGMSRQSLQEALDLRNRNHFHKIYLLPALRAVLIEMTIPDKPRSSKQRYRLTPTGNNYLKRNREAR